MGNVDVTFHISNPSKKPLELKPFEFTIFDMLTQITSLDRNAADGEGTPHNIASASLGEEVRVEAESETDIVLRGSTDSSTSMDADLAVRLYRDCGSGSVGRTKIKVQIVSGTVSVGFGYGFAISSDDYVYDLDTSCQV